MTANDESINLFLDESQKLKQTIDNWLQKIENISMSQIVELYYQVINVNSLAMFSQNINNSSDEDTQNKILNDLEILSKISIVNVIPSRRTPPQFIKRLAMIKNQNINFFSDLFDPITYGNLLSESNMQIVTWDSISMISEAISSETGTFLYEFEKESCPRRYQLFHQMVIQKGFLKSFSRNMRPYTISMIAYNSELKSKILNKIESNLWFKNSVS